MTLDELSSHLAEKLSISKTVAHQAINTLGEAVAVSLSKGDKVTLPGIGNLSVGLRAERSGRNPRTGETIQIPAKKVIKFSAASSLDRTVNNK